MDNEITHTEHSSGFSPDIYTKVLNSIIEIHGIPVILDYDVAKLYKVDTRVINQAVKRNSERFPLQYRFRLSPEDYTNLKSQNVISSWGGARKIPYAFTEKGLYMLATVLRSKQAVDVTFAIIETFAKVRNLKSEIVALHKEKNQHKQSERMHRFSDLLSDIVMPDLETTETESTLELNFFIGKIKHTVKRIKTNNSTDEETDK